MTTEATVHGHAHAPATAAHQEHEGGLDRAMFGMVLFIASEVMLFGGLFACYFYVRNQAATWPPQVVDLATGAQHEIVTANALLGGFLTAILLLSGLIGHFGIVALRTGVFGLSEKIGFKVDNRKGLLIGLVGAIVLGTIFIIGQAYEWLNLMDEGLTAKTTTYGSTFFTMTGFHGAHVIAGLLMLGAAFVRASAGDFTPKRHTYADASMLYWHFVDVVWVILYAFIYFKWP